MQLHLEYLVIRELYHMPLLVTIYMLIEQSELSVKEWRECGEGGKVWLRNLIC